MLKVCGGLVLTFGAMPEPLSLIVTVTTEDPLAPAAGVKLRAPPGVIAGAALNNDGLVALTAKDKVWVTSGSPSLIPLAQPGTD